MFPCVVQGRTARWEVDSFMLQQSIRLEQVGMSVPLRPRTVTDQDKDFGFVIHVLSTSTATMFFSELRVTAVEELNGVMVECVALSETYTATIQVAVGLVGE